MTNETHGQTDSTQRLFHLYPDIPEHLNTMNVNGIHSVGLTHSQCDVLWWVPDSQIRSWWLLLAFFFVLFLVQFLSKIIIAHAPKPEKNTKTQKLRCLCH
jgi:hypothetical protein